MTAVNKYKWFKMGFVMARLARPLQMGLPSTRGNSYITDICLHFLLGRDPWLPTATWVRLLVALDVPSATARSALHRMDKGGFLDRLSCDGVPGYAMSASWQAFMYSATESDPKAVEDQTRWVLVSFSIPETRRDQRHVMRLMLERSGFTSLGNGLWIGPEVAEPYARRLIKEAKLDQYTEIFLAEYRGFSNDAVAYAQRCWDLRSAAQRFAELETAIHAELERPTSTGQEAFVSVVSMHNAFRLLDTKTPLLPARMFPGEGSRPRTVAAMGELLNLRLPSARAWVTER